MKKLFRSMLCAALLAVTVSIPAFAAEREVPQKQGDFYVLVNGTYVTFTDAVPQIQNSRSCLPFVAVFEQLGFAEEDMTWDGAASTVTATKGDTTIALTIGQNQIVLTKAGQTTTIDTDVSPYIDPALSRTYVPFGLVADALGYKVGWDAQQGTVIIDDLDAILAANEATYELIDQYIAYSKSFSEKNQSVTGSYAMDYITNVTAENLETSVGINMAGTYKMLTSGAAAMQFETDMIVDMTVTGEDAALAGDALADFPMTVDFDMRGDMADGVFYVQSAALSDMAGVGASADVWYKLDIAAMFDQIQDVLGMDYSALMQMSLDSLNQSFEQSLVGVLDMLPLVSADMTTSDYLAQLNALLADSAFVKSGTTYTSKMEQDGAVISFILYTSGTKVTGYGITMTAADPAFGKMELSASMQNTKMEMTMEIDFEIPVDASSAIEMTMTMTMDGTYKSTSEVPATEPPSGATVIDLFQLLSLGALTD